MRYSALGAARRMVVKGPNPLHHHTHQSEVHIYATVQKQLPEGSHECGSCIGAGGAFDSPTGCPQ
jgi:hypothetical protein